MPRPRKDGSMQLCLPLLTLREKVERRAYYEAKTGKFLGSHRRRRHELGQGDKPRGAIADAIAKGSQQAGSRSQD